MKMQKGFLYARVRSKAMNNTLGFLAMSAFAALFAGVGVNMYLDDDLPFALLILIGGGASMVSLLLVAVAIASFREWLDPSRTDVFQNLKRYGNPLDIVVEIEMEMTGESERFGPVQFLESWMVCTADELYLVKYPELRRSEHVVTAKRVKGVAVGEIHTLNWTTDHDEFELSVPTKDVENLLLCVRQRTESGSVDFC